MENSCFLCDKTSNVIVYEENGFQSRPCPECGLLYCNPLPHDGEVDFENDSHTDSFYKKPSQYKSKWLAEKIGAGKSLLEIGAGNGHLLNEFYNCGYDVAGLEPNTQRVNNIKNVYHLQTHQGYLESYDFKEKKFDVVYHVDLLAHFPDPLFAIQKMKEVTAKDGYISFEVGVVGGISTFWYKLFPLGLPQHRWLYSEKSLKKLLETAKLRVVHKTTHSLAPYLFLKKLSGWVLIGILKRLLDPFIGKRTAVLVNLHNNFTNFLRYSVGRYFPNLGPLTILYIAKSEE